MSSPGLTVTSWRLKLLKTASCGQKGFLGLKSARTIESSKGLTRTGKLELERAGAKRLKKVLINFCNV